MTDPQEEADKARKERSPSFPFISLKKAVERLKEMADAHRRNQARMVTVGATWGYAAKSSGLLQTVAALKAFGLIDDMGGGPERKIQVSELGWRILHDARPGAHEAAIREAALKPRLIAEYAAQWIPERPSDAHCLSELQLDRGFNDIAARLFLKVFDDTRTYANLKNRDIVSPISNVDDDIMYSPTVASIPPAPAATGSAGSFPASRLPAAEPFTMAFGPGRLRGTFDLTEVEQADKMIEAINAMKAFLKAKEAAN